MFIKCTLPLHVIQLFNHQYVCFCTYGLASILAEDIKPRASCTFLRVRICAHIRQGVVIRVVARLLSSRIMYVLFSSCKIVSDHFKYQIILSQVLMISCFGFIWICPKHVFNHFRVTLFLYFSG